METERLEQTTLFSTENPAPLEVKLEPVTTPQARASGDRTLLPLNLHRSVSLAPGLCLSTLLGFVSWTSYLHTQCCRQPRYRYATSFVKFTYWRKYEVRKSQKHSQVKNQVAWICQPCCSSAGKKVPSTRGG